MDSGLVSAALVRRLRTISGIAERYAAGETMAELARQYECGEATIWRVLQ